eukprot:4359778-Amphidinium_carterae.2
MIARTLVTCVAVYLKLQAALLSRLVLPQAQARGSCVSTTCQQYTQSTCLGVFRHTFSVGVYLRSQQTSAVHCHTWKRPESKLMY